jgi:hypothetical protein
MKMVNAKVTIRINGKGAAAIVLRAFAGFYFLISLPKEDAL